MLRAAGKACAHATTYAPIENPSGNRAINWRQQTAGRQGGHVGVAAREDGSKPRTGPWV